MLVGYARVSTDDQNLNLQRDALNQAGCGKLIFHIFGALAEFELNLVRERTQAGLQAARASGRKGGRPKALNEEKRMLAVKLYDDKAHSVDQVCQMMGISKPTLYKYIEASRNPLS